MYYSKLVQKASQIAFQAHKYDVDKGGYPYIFHPYTLAYQCEDEATCCVALLHDVIEDHGDMVSFEMLEKEGFNSEIIEALRLLTHDENVSYMDYIHEIKTNPIARKVKILDLKHNMDTRRMEMIPRKYALYQQALNYLEK